MSEVEVRDGGASCAAASPCRRGEDAKKENEGAGWKVILHDGKSINIARTFKTDHKTQQQDWRSSMALRLHTM
ncbi:hypothetical protein HanIR_Chr03g0125261 [Helianthus annuus]|nr:hypothetical protein HanIR_Chr03g0125261 [Helianthus annuus]